MSFRIKSSHKFVNPPQNSAPPKKPLDFLGEEQKGSKKRWSSLPSRKKVPDNTAKMNAKVGLSIRPSARALEDYY